MTNESKPTKILLVSLPRQIEHGRRCPLGDPRRRPSGSAVPRSGGDAGSCQPGTSDGSRDGRPRNKGQHISIKLDVKMWLTFPLWSRVH